MQPERAMRWMYPSCAAAVAVVSSEELPIRVADAKAQVQAAAAAIETETTLRNAAERTAEEFQAAWSAASSAAREASEVQAESPPLVLALTISRSLCRVISFFMTHAAARSAVLCPRGRCR